MPCVKNVDWKVAPSNLFSSTTTSIGETVILVPTDDSRGAATIQFVLSSEACNDAEIEQSFLMGRPIETTHKKIIKI